MIELCKTCKHKEILYNGIVGCIFMDADCKKGEKYEPYTNADRIRAMSDDELAEFLYDCEFLHICKEGCGECHYNGECEKRIAEWLKQPAEEE